MNANKTLAAAIRARGIKDVRTVWTEAKAMLASGATPKQAAARLTKAPTRVSQPTAQYRAATPLVAQDLKIRLYRGDAAFDAMFDIGGARPKLRGKGNTHNVTAAVPGGHELTTLSPKSVERLLSGSRVWMGLGGGKYQAEVRH
jgi:hypothetical protein